MEAPPVRLWLSSLYARLWYADALREARDSSVTRMGGFTRVQDRFRELHRAGAVAYVACQRDH